MRTLLNNVDYRFMRPQKKNFLTEHRKIDDVAVTFNIRLKREPLMFRREIKLIQVRPVLERYWSITRTILPIKGKGFGPGGSLDSFRFMNFREARYTTIAAVVPATYGLSD
jgi:hypothetical protein